MARACTKLTKLRIHELSIVDAGANQGALAVLMKRDAGAAGPTGDQTMADKTAPTLEDLDKAVKAAADENAKVLAEKAQLEADKAELQKQLDAANAALDALPSTWPVRGFRHDVEPANFSARMGLYSFDAGTPLTAGTWIAARTDKQRARGNLELGEQVLRVAPGRWLWHDSIAADLLA